MIERYLSRLQNTIYSRREIEAEQLVIRPTSARAGHIWGRLRFYDGSSLVFEERVLLTEGIEKVHYRYHYQRADGSLIFRYDNAPHYPDLPNLPHHVHLEDRVEPADPPDLHDVLRNVDRYLYGSGRSGGGRRDRRDGAVEGGAEYGNRGQDRGHRLCL